MVAMVEKNIVAFLFCDCPFLQIDCLMKAYTTSTLFIVSFLVNQNLFSPVIVYDFCIIQQVLY